MASEKLPYQIRLTGAAVRALERLPAADQRRLAETIDSLAIKPRPRGCEKIAGGRSFLRVRAGSYRIVYAVDDRKRAVLVIAIGHRRDVYRGLR